MKITDAFQKAPILATTTKTVANASFDQSAWLNGLKPADKELLDTEITHIHDSWLPHLHKEISKPQFLNLKKFLASREAAGVNIFPPKKDIYSWTSLTPFDKVKVIIIGQDPYHGKNQAHGLAFSVNPPTPPPPSLKNMYKCLKNDYPDFDVPAKSGLLTPWAEQGVLMLNTVLTVEEKKANAHKDKGWEAVTFTALSAAVKHNSGCVILAWGSPAAKIADKMNIDKSKHLVLKAVHPSPLSAHRGFLTCGHFKQANEWLEKRYGPEGIIEWGLEGKTVGSKGTKEATTDTVKEELAKESIKESVETVKEPTEQSSVKPTSAKSTAPPSSQEKLDQLLLSVPDVDDDELDDILPPPKKQKV
ncbi:uracil-DNA glycosylase-like protein [Yarrowia lipolytica]|jgi:uracil-DNA glycosylase|uniref:Uracil-DNA glycosylase n=1 Tax=Yarrowia lipolytica TaxID=4952 RepID=A0A371CAX8_YARLL|nr:Uracil-DNA glycosylase [Yarrowia lipolytica]RDW27425.1 uracil-DNA glycosylase-like protein [Yarrowia lipolytica]RDW33734.1 uracil-DNA glycosylase-like protein [Yarrowia lipolytica]RDW40460.1 uracil-DNA glycosylase-like protein [Yarrowia lipolytica]RDW48699.1 uracil-DNA glycosylase-like protein [Yarrowia lipolytica]